MAGLSRGLTKRGHSVRVIRASTLTPIAATLRYATRLAGRLDVVHVQGLGDMPSLAAGCLAGLTFARGSLVTAHGSGDSYWSKSHLNYVTRRGLVQRFDTVISVSHYIDRKLMRVIGSTTRHTTIYNGVDADHFRPGPDPSHARSRFGLEGRFVLLFVGRLTPEKGLVTLVSSLPLIRREIPSIALVVCGRGRMEPRLKTQARELGVSDVIRFVGPVAQAQLPPYYDAADVVVIPSREEAFPIVSLEGMSMMKPVIASDVGGVPEVVRHDDTGLLVSPSDPSSLAEAVLRVHGDQALGERLGRNGRRLVEERFTWELIAAEIEKAYLEAMN
jgi:glycosyltransferase involved in cell wall biosynthesis